MKLKFIFLILFSLFISYNAYGQRFVETISGNKNGGICIFNTYTETDIPSCYSCSTADTVFGIKNVLRQRDYVNTYYNNRRLIASSNEAINNTLNKTTIGVRGYAENRTTSSYSDPVLYGVFGHVKGGKGLNYGVYGTTDGSGRENYGVYGEAIINTSNAQSTSYGVFGSSISLNPNYSNYGVFGYAYNAVDSDKAFAGYFQGKVHVNGTLSKSAGTFKIDHPLDPENKYLSHSFVENPDMMNIYNGNITTDNNGLATVILPTYFEALNMDFRYQLTCLGQFAQAIIIEKVKNNQFKIQTDKLNTEVSWQIIGVRNDAYAQKNRVVPETEKPANERGKYLNPDSFGKPKATNIHFHEEVEVKK